MASARAGWLKPVPRRPAAVASRKSAEPAAELRVGGGEDLVQPLDLVLGRFSPQPDLDLEAAVGDRNVEAVEQVGGKPSEDELAKGGRQRVGQVAPVVDRLH